MGESHSVVHVMWGWHVGGIQRYVHDLALEQRDLGLRPSIAVGAYDDYRIGCLQRAGISVEPLGVRSRRDLNPKRLAPAVRKLRRADVIHLHDFTPALGALVMSMRNVPMVYTEHIPLSVTSPVARKARSWFLRSCAKGIVAVSNYTASMMNRELGLDGRVITIHNGSRFADQCKAERPRRSGSLQVAYVGRLSDWKRVDRIIRGVASARSRESIELTIAGDGPMLGALRRRTHELGLDGTVDFLGWVDEVDELLASVDVLVLATRGEPFGLIVLEATAQGALPIVYADGGGAREALPPDGIVVETDEQLGSTLDALRDSPLLSAEARAERARWARSNFSIADGAARYVDLYRQIAPL